MSLKNISVRQLTKFSITSVAQELFIDSLISNHDDALCNENENFVHSIAAAWWIDGTA